MNIPMKVHAQVYKYILCFLGISSIEMLEEMCIKDRDILQLKMYMEC